MPRPIFILLLVAAVVGCAHQKTKSDTDNSAASGFATIDNGVKHTREAIDGIAAGPLTPEQKAHVEAARKGQEEVVSGATTANKAYTATATENKRFEDKQNDRIFPYLLIGAGVIAVGVFLLVGGSAFGVAYGAATVAAGLGWIATLILVKSITKPLEYAAWALIGVGTIAAVYLIIERIKTQRDRQRKERELEEANREKERKAQQLAMEQKATTELVATVEKVREELPLEVDQKLFGKPGEKGRDMISGIQSDTTRKLVAAAKAETLMSDAADVAAQKVLDEATSTSG